MKDYTYTFRRTNGVEIVERQGSLVATGHGRGLVSEPGFEKENIKLAMACRHARAAGFWSGPKIAVTVVLSAEEVERARCAEALHQEHIEQSRGED